MLGPLTITGGSKHGRRLRGATRELLGYLALHPAGAQRDQIIDALWPEQTPEQGRNRLWRAVADARAHLGDSTVTRDGDRYEINRIKVSIDLDELERQLSELGRTDKRVQHVALIDQTLRLFQGEPLAGSDFTWAESHQRHLRAIHVDLIEQAGSAKLLAGDASGALAHADRGLATEPYNEKLARLAMRAESALGLRSSIIARYESLVTLLDQQLGLQPDRDTRRLYRQLLSQDEGSPAHPTVGATR